MPSVMSCVRAMLGAVFSALCFAVIVSAGSEVYRRDLCGKMIHREHKGSITSHKRFRDTLYPKSYKCVWRLLAPPLHRIQVVIPEMSIEYDGHCGFDHLDIYDDVNTSNASRRIARLCGQERYEYISSGAYMTLSWMSDKSIRKSGFLIRYNFIPESAVPRGYRIVRRTRTARCFKGVRCNDGFCVNKHFVCDGISDCHDKADERKCSGATTQPSTAKPTNPVTQHTTKTPPIPPASTVSQTCGSPNILPDEDESRVVGGKVAVSGSWPWTVSLRYNGSHTCGGSILSPRWVLTAAHCVEGYSSASSYTIVAGLHRETNTGAATQTIRVKRIFIHPRWNSQATDYDYTLLYLASPLTYTSRVGPICLPSKVLGGAVGCFVAGWGDTKGTGGAGFLKQAFVKTFTPGECQGFYGGITNRMICAGHREGGRDTCKGDSGGPLMCKVGGKWELHGATSFGGVCAAPNSPGVYARVSTVVNWIKATSGA